MFWARASATRWLVSRTKASYRSYSSRDGAFYLRGRILGPVTWSVGACSAIYLSFASYDVWRDAQRLRAHGKVLKSFEELENSGTRENARVLNGLASERPEFSDHLDIKHDRMVLTLRVIGLTIGAHIMYSVSPRMQLLFAHIPGSTLNFTLFTSTFGHAGLLHLGVNMYGMFYLMPYAAHSPVLKASGTHLMAFYLSAGILSGLAQHIAAIGLRRGVLTPSLGASGALFALFGIVGVSFPQTQVGIILLPGSIRIDEALVWLALFDALGIFVRYPWLNFAHASHLGGLALGVAYARYGGDWRVWRPARKVAFNTLHTLGLL